MALQGEIFVDLPNQTQTISFQNPNILDSITYSSGVIQYPVTNTFTLSQSDFALFILYKTQFYQSLISNFPVVGLSFQAEVLAAQIRLLSTLGPNLFTFNQTTTGSYNLVYNMTFDRNAKTVGFQARTNQISITLQEYLMAFPVLMQYANQVAIYK